MTFERVSVFATLIYTYVCCVLHHGLALFVSIWHLYGGSSDMRMYIYVDLPESVVGAYKYCGRHIPALWFGMPLLIVTPSSLPLLPPSPLPPSPPSFLSLLSLLSLPPLTAAVCENGSVRLSLDQRDPLTSELVDDEIARGRVEVCSGGSFQTLCVELWSYEDASVVCSQLGFSPHGQL